MAKEPKHENCILLGYYAVSSDNFVCTAKTCCSKS